MGAPSQRPLRQFSGRRLKAFPMGWPMKHLDRSGFFFYIACSLSSLLNFSSCSNLKLFKIKNVQI
jgi:hypothetical protein